MASVTTPSRPSLERHEMRSLDRQRGERELREWLAAATGTLLPEHAEPAANARALMEALADGAVLCRLANAVQPGAVPNVLEESSTPIQFLRAYENIGSFLSFAASRGLAPEELFSWADLAKAQNFDRVLACLLRFKAVVARGESLGSASAPASPAAASAHMIDSAQASASAMIDEAVVTAPPASVPSLVLPRDAEPRGELMMEPCLSPRKAAEDAAAVIASAPVASIASGEVQDPANATLLSSLNSAYRSAVERKNNDIKELNDRASAYQRHLDEYRAEKRRMEQTLAEEKERLGQIRKEKADPSGTDAGGGNAASAAAAAAGASAQSTVSNAKSVLRRFIGRPVERTNKSYKTFAAGVRGVFAEMHKTMSETVSAVVEATRAHSISASTMAEKLDRERREKQKLLNKVVELQGNIRVYCRVRPLSSDERARGQRCAVEVSDENEIGILSLPAPSAAGAAPSSVNAAAPPKNFQFDRVFGPGTSQQQVFEDVDPFVRCAVDGFNVCIFAYGQTGSGKTFTMEGPPQNRGVNYRALQLVFELIAERKISWTFDVDVSVVEIYNEQPRDLLCSDAQAKVDLRQSKEGGVHIPGLTHVAVGSTDEVMDVMFKRAYPNRQVGSTSMNEHSSRSHCLLFINIRGRDLHSEQRTLGRLILIDLAGSERIKRSEAVGERLKEAQFINKSLSTLGTVISALQSQSAHVPFRDSKLTYLLQDSLSGNSKCLMFCNVSPAEEDSQETVCSLQFAQRVARVQLGAAKRNVQSGDVFKLKSQMMHAQEEIKSRENEALSLRQKVAAAESASESKEAALSKLQARLDEQSKALEEARRAVARLEQELSTQKSQYQLLAEQHEQAAQQLAKKQQREQQLQQEVQKQQQAVAELQQQQQQQQQALAKKQQQQKQQQQQQQQQQHAAPPPAVPAAAPAPAAPAPAAPAPATLPVAASSAVARAPLTLLQRPEKSALRLIAPQPLSVLPPMPARPSLSLGELRPPLAVSSAEAAAPSAPPSAAPPAHTPLVPPPTLNLRALPPSAAAALSAIEASRKRKFSMDAAAAAAGAQPALDSERAAKAARVDGGASSALSIPTHARENSAENLLRGLMASASSAAGGPHAPELLVPKTPSRLEAVREEPESSPPEIERSLRSATPAAAAATSGAVPQPKRVHFGGTAVHAIERAPKPMEARRIRTPRSALSGGARRVAPAVAPSERLDWNKC